MLTIARILVATDFGEAADAAFDYGAALAKYFHAELTLLHVVDELNAAYLGAEGYVADLSQLQQELEAAAGARVNDRLKSAGIRSKAIVRTSNTPAETIVNYATEADIDLIVVGTHGRGGLPRLVMGSVAERIVRTAHCPVLTLHGQPQPLVESALRRAADHA